MRKIEPLPDMESNIETLRAVYTRLISGGAERPNEELKSYALTEDVAKAEARKLAETIAGIANHSYSHGFVVCAASGSTSDPQIDGAKLDDLITKFVHPRVIVNLQREEIDGKTVDFVIIPKSDLRPHLMRIDDGRYVVPFRGIANNTSAARTELDHIYREQILDMMRSAFPGIRIGESDPVGAYLDRIGYGLGRTDQPQLAFLIVPASVPKRIIANDDLLTSRQAQNRILQFSTDAINADFKRHEGWFSAHSGLTCQTREDHLEIAQVGRFTVGDKDRPDPYLWAARVYVIGTVTYSTIMYPAEFTNPPGAFDSGWFKNIASATLTFANLVYEALNVPIDKLMVRALLKNAENLQLMRPGLPYMPVRTVMIDPQPAVLIPTHEPIQTTKTTLRADIPAIIEELGRVLESRFHTSRLSP